MGLFAVNRSESSADVEDEDNIEKLTDTKQLLWEYMDEHHKDQPGYTVVLDDPALLAGRTFVVVDGNHRLAALKAVSGEEIKCAWARTLNVRMAVLRRTSLDELVKMGSLLNKIRGVQADDNYYDRVMAVVYQIK